jgi:predicted TIM-barrel fold metal-dependent hydrolase
MAQTDVHQHLWTPSFLEALGRRHRAPCARWAGGRWRVQVPGDEPAVVDPAAHDPGLRARALPAAGLDRALLATSLPLGVELLEPEEAWPVLDAWHADVAALGEEFGHWASIPLRGAGEAEVARGLAAGAVGLAVPAAALATPEGLYALGPVLAALEARGAPLLVHPGPVAEGAHPPRPAWWPALTDYVAELHAAWHAFVAWGRPAHPALRVCFVALAGLAPLHVERLAARGGPSSGAADPGIFYETSSYGARAIDAVARVVGVDQLVFGSDRPVVDGVPPDALGPAARAAMLGRNVARLLDGAGR